MITFDQERPCDFAEIEQLLDIALGPERHKKSSHILRQDIPGLNPYSCVARAEGHILATVRFSPVHIKDLLFDGNTDALFLGPLAVSPLVQGAGIGSTLAEYALAGVKTAGHKRVFLVGDSSFYSRFGFEPVLPRYISMSDGRDASRLLVKQAADMAPLPLFGQLQPHWCSVDNHYMQPVDSWGTAA